MLQSSMPTPGAMDTAGRAFGLTLRGVVVSVYEYDTEGPPGLEGQSPNALYVDVMCYGRHQGRLPRVLWTYDRSGLQEGPIVTPRKTSFDVQGEFDLDSVSNPANWDGDHVIIGFLEDDLTQPYVQRCLPHPSSDIGNSELAVGHRMRVKEEDGVTRLYKNNGGVFGLDKDGNWLLDLRAAHSGQLNEDGTEPLASLDGTNGNARLLLPENSSLRIGITKDAQTLDSHDPNPDSETTSILVENNKITIEIEGGPPLTLTMEGGDWTLANTGDTTLNTDGAVHLGTGATHPIIHGDTYQSDMNTMNAVVSAHFNGILAAITAFAGAQSVPIAASADSAIWLALIASLSTIGGTGAAAGAAVSAFDAAIAAQLSSDVDAK